MSGILLLDHFAVEKVGDGESAHFEHFNAPFISSTIAGSIPTSLNVLPKPGKYKHPQFGVISLDAADNIEFIKNFNAAVYQTLIPIDMEHKLVEFGAAGYMKAGTGRIDENGAGWVDVEWTDRGRKALENGRFQYFSPSWMRKWADPATEESYNNVLVGGALTSRPHFKENSLKPLFASELFAEETKEEEIMPEEKKEIVVNNNEIVSPQQFAEVQAQLQAFREQAEKDARDKQEMREQLEKTNAELARNATISRLRHFSEIVDGRDPSGDGAEKFKGDLKMHSAVLEALAEKYGEESQEFSDYVAHERSLAAQLEENNELTKSRGGPGTSEPRSTDGEKQWFSEVGKVMAERNMNEMQASNFVAKEQPKLYNAYRKAVSTKRGDDE